MKKEEILQESGNLDRQMGVAVYGEGGYPVIVLPSQNAMHGNWEDFGMVDAVADYLDAGRVQLFCLDSVDAETWSDVQGDNERRAETQEAYYRYVCDEVVPLVHERNGSGLRPLVTGTSLGATQAVILMLRRPDLFQGCIAMSGTYDSADFFGGWMNDTLYLNAPTTFLPNMPADHPYVDLYNQRQIVLCAGQGAWEDESVRTQGLLDAAFRDKGIGAWCDYWGDDVSHDWPWWQKQIRYFLPIVLEKVPSDPEAQAPAARQDIPVSAVAEEEACAAAAMATPAPAPATKPAAKKAPARKAAAKKTATKKAATTKKATTTSSAAKPSATAKKAATTKKKAAAATTEAKPAAATKASTAKKAATTKKAAGTAAKKSSSTTTAKKASTATAAKKTAATTKAAAEKPAAKKASTAKKAATTKKAAE